MSAPWIQIYASLPEHPKTYALAAALHLQQYAAVGLLVSLWSWAANNALDGDLTHFPDRAITRACGVTKNAARLIPALVEAGFVDQDERGRRLHDWQDYAGLLLIGEQQRRDKHREKMRRLRATENKQLPPCAASVPVTKTAQGGHSDGTVTRCAIPTVPNPTGQDNTLHPQLTPAVSAALAGFARMRADKRRPLTPETTRLIVKRVQQLSAKEDIQIAILEQSTVNGWSDVYALNASKQQDKKAPPDHSPGSFEHEAVARMSRLRDDPTKGED